MANNDDTSSKVKLKPIKLVVKKPSKPDETKEQIKPDNNKKNHKKKNEQYMIELFSSIKIVVIVILILAISVLSINIYREVNDEPIISALPTLTKSKDGLFSNWQTINGYTFTFNEDYEFFIYESGPEVKNNYFEGTYTYVENEKAVLEMGYESIEDFKNNTVIDNIEAIYSIQMIPKKYIKNNSNIINRKIEDNEKWWFILILTSNNEAIAYNKTLDLRYKLTRN